MNWDEYIEKYGEYPEEHFDDPAEYWESRGDRHRARMIRNQRENDPKNYRKERESKE